MEDYNNNYNYTFNNNDQYSYQYSNQNSYLYSNQYTNQNQYSNIDPYSIPYLYQYPYKLSQLIPITNPLTLPVPPPSSGKGKGQFPSKAPDSKSISLRIMSFNILQGGKRDGSLETRDHEWKALRKLHCINMYKDINPDIAMLQECRREQLNDLKANLPFYTYYSYAKDGVLSKGFKDGDAHNDASFKNAGQRNVIMLRTGMFEVLQWGKFWLSDTPHMASKGFETNGTKITLWLKVRHIISGKEFHIFNSHFLPRSYGKTAEKNLELS